MKKLLFLIPFITINLARSEGLFSSNPKALLNSTNTWTKPQTFISSITVVMGTTSFNGNAYVWPSTAPSAGQHLVITFQANGYNYLAWGGDGGGSGGGGGGAASLAVGQGSLVDFLQISSPTTHISVSTKDFTVTLISPTTAFIASNYAGILNSSNVWVANQYGSSITYSNIVISSNLYVVNIATIGTSLGVNGVGSRFLPSIYLAGDIKTGWYRGTQDQWNFSFQTSDQFSFASGISMGTGIQFKSADGTVGIPGISFNNCITCGFYAEGGPFNAIKFGMNSIERFGIWSGGQMTIGRWGGGSGTVNFPPAGLVIYSTQNYPSLLVASGTVASPTKLFLVDGASTTIGGVEVVVGSATAWGGYTSTTGFIGTSSTFAYANILFSTITNILANSATSFYLVNTSYTYLGGTPDIFGSGGMISTGIVNIYASPGAFTNSLTIVGDQARAAITMISHGGANVFLSGRSSNGTKAAPTASVAPDVLMKFGGSGHDGTQIVAGNRAQLNFLASENWSLTNQGTRIQFLATPLGGTTNLDSFDLNGSTAWTNVPLIINSGVASTVIKSSFSLSVSSTVDFNSVTISTNGWINAASSTTIWSLSSCGTSQIYGGGSAFSIIASGSPTGCTINFVPPFQRPPIPQISQRSLSLVNSLSYTITEQALTITQTGMGSLDIHLFGADR